MKSLRLRQIVAWMLLLMMGAGLLVAHVWKQNLYIQVSKKERALRKQSSDLANSVAALELRITKLKSCERIEKLARERLGLELGSAPILVYQEGKSGDKPEAPTHLAGAWWNRWLPKGL